MLYIFFYSFNFSWVPGINRVKMPMFNRTFNCKVPFSLLKRVNSTPHSPPSPRWVILSKWRNTNFPPGGRDPHNKHWLHNKSPGRLLKLPDTQAPPKRLWFHWFGDGSGHWCLFFIFVFLNKLFGWFYSREGKPLTKDTPATGSNGSSEREK